MMPSADATRFDLRFYFFLLSERARHEQICAPRVQRAHSEAMLSPPYAYDDAEATKSASDA